MRSLVKFKSLNLDQKGNLIFTEDKYLAVRYYYNYAVNLYELYDFFVEVWYSPEGNKIEKIEVLEDEKKSNYILLGTIMKN